MAHYSLINGALAIALAGALSVGPALAEKPSWAGEKGGKGHKSNQHEKREGHEGPRGDKRAVQSVGHFSDPHRAAAREYYDGRFKSGHCPPGLAKKRNGCMPPGQAKKWELGRPLSRDVIYHEVPRPLVEQFGQPPAGYRYVRVDADVLMIAIGTALVVDAIRNLGR